MMLLGVLGNPVAHSRSPEIHQQFSDSCGLDIDYQKVLVATGTFTDVAKQFLAQGAVGFNITVPNKYDAYLLADTVSESAESAEAVNTIELLSDGTIKGHNTDGPGIVADIKDNLGWQLADKNILVLGAGGAVRGVLGSLLSEMPASIDILNRTYQTAEDVVTRFSNPRLNAKLAGQLDSPYDLIISGSSAGLGEGISINLPATIIGENTCCYDMIYAKKLTPFLQWCQEQGALSLSDGLGMLVEQAALAFEIWSGKSVETHNVIEKLRNASKSLAN